MRAGAAQSVAGGVVRREQSLAQLDLLVTRKLDGLLHGEHESLLHGTGSEPGDSREYQPGDDARRIDWNLTARSSTTHVRDTIADRELETWLLFDCSASLDFGTAACEKRDLAMAGAAAFGLLTAKAGNRLGALCFDGRGTTVHAPRSGREHALGLLHRLDQRARAGEGAGSLAGALAQARMVARPGVLVVISDLLDESAWGRQLRAATATHEVIVAQVTDPREAELPAVGLLTLVDPETGRRREVQTANPRLRARFAEAAARQRAEIATTVRRSGAGHLVLSTDRDWLADVARFAVARRRRR
jgi:uncharacterized protein (DUF58 family)